MFRRFWREFYDCWLYSAHMMFLGHEFAKKQMYKRMDEEGHG